MGQTTDSTALPRDIRQISEKVTRGQVIAAETSKAIQMNHVGLKGVSNFCKQQQHFCKPKRKTKQESKQVNMVGSCDQNLERYIPYNQGGNSVRRNNGRLA